MVFKNSFSISSIPSIISQIERLTVSPHRSCKRFEMQSQIFLTTLHSQKMCSTVSLVTPQKEQSSLSQSLHLYKKVLVGTMLWRSLNWKILILLSIIQSFDNL